MKLTNLFKNHELSSGEEITVAGLCYDSRYVKEGDLFVAITCDDVINHVIAALKNKAAAVVIDSEVLAHNQSRLPHAIYVPVKNARQRLSVLARQFHPQQPRVIAAI